MQRGVCVHQLHRLPVDRALLRRVPRQEMGEVQQREGVRHHLRTHSGKEFPDRALPEQQSDVRRPQVPSHHFPQRGTAPGRTGTVPRRQQHSHATQGQRARQSEQRQRPQQELSGACMLITVSSTAICIIRSAILTPSSSSTTTTTTTTILTITSTSSSSSSSSSSAFFIYNSRSRLRSDLHHHLPRFWLLVESTLWDAPHRAVEHGVATFRKNHITRFSRRRISSSSSSSLLPLHRHHLHHHHHLPRYSPSRHSTYHHRRTGPRRVERGERSARGGCQSTTPRAATFRIFLPSAARVASPVCRLRHHSTTISCHSNDAALARSHFARTAPIGFSSFSPSTIPSSTSTAVNCLSCSHRSRATTTNDHAHVSGDGDDLPFFIYSSQDHHHCIATPTTFFIGPWLCVSTHGLGVFFFLPFLFV